MRRVRLTTDVARSRCVTAGALRLNSLRTQLRSRTVRMGAAPFSSTAAPADGPRVGIVGTGPAAFYTAKYLLKELASARVDMFDALPTPYGLVRFGVAPDHPEVKLVQNDFAAVASDPRCQFFGNVKVGVDITIPEMRKFYNAVVLAYGAGGERDLDIPGNRLREVHSARTFVNWYNGHPEFAQRKFDLSCENAVIVGHGNVAIDVARILCTPIDQLRKTDMAEHALEALSHSKIKRVFVVGRRGPVQAAFTIKELRELTVLPGCTPVILREEIDAGLTPASHEELKQRPKKRKMDLLEEIAAKKASTEKEIQLRFLLNPSRFTEDGTTGRVGAAVFERTKLVGAVDKQEAVGTGQFETLPAGIVFKSIGYKSLPMPGLPFDNKRHVIPSRVGRVTDTEGATQPGFYVSGWLKRGPSGIIATNIVDAKETVASLVQDVKAGAVGSSVDAAPGAILAALRAKTDRDGRPLRVVTRADWARIDSEEQSRGASAGKPRSKLVHIDDMLKVAEAPKS